MHRIMHVTRDELEIKKLMINVHISQNKVDESYASLIAKPWHGNHGFDNDDLDMMAIFAAYGPGRL